MNLRNADMTKAMSGAMMNDEALSNSIPSPEIIRKASNAPAIANTDEPLKPDIFSAISIIKDETMTISML